MSGNSKSESLSTVPAEPVDTPPGRSGIALCALVMCALIACVSATDQPTTGESAQPILSQVGIERVIPVHYYVLDTPSSPCPNASNVSTSVIYAALRDANATFQAAGIQFSVARIDRLTMPTFRDLDVSTAVPAHTAPMYTWASVYAELQAIDPTLTSTTFSGSDFDEGWLSRVADRLTPTEIPMMVPCSDNAGQGGGHASYPPSHSIHIPADRIGYGTQRHEFGHYLGLQHTFEAWTNDRIYDQVYGTNSTNTTSTFFTSPAALTAFRTTPGNRVLRKDGRVDDISAGGFGSGALIWSWVDGNTPTTTHSCEMQITMGGTTYRTSTHPNQMRGIQHAVAGAAVPYSVNFMSYASCPRINQENLAIYDMEPSQIEEVRRVLRDPSGQRNQLGRASVRQGPRRNSTVDFDGDLKHDIAYYRPSTSQCVVRYSSTGVEHTITLTGGDPTLGDTPMLGDYDGDGKTDCAVYRAGASVVGGASSTWLWAASSAGNAMHTEYFGWTGDIPISDVRLKAVSSSYGRYGVFRPSNHTFYWWSNAGVVASATLGYAGDEFVLGDYDRDGWTDLALWHPASSGAPPTLSYFAILYSADNYATWHSWQWGQETDVPIGAVSRDGDAQLDFAVWRPSNGTWYYLLNPRTNGTYGASSQQWGGVGDVPMPGFDLDNDGLADEAIWRPAGSGAQIWYRNTATNTSAGYNIGMTGDVPMWVPDTNGDYRPELLIYRRAGTPVGTFHGLTSSMGGYPSFAPIATTMLHADILL